MKRILLTFGMTIFIALCFLLPPNLIGTAQAMILKMSLQELTADADSIITGQVIETTSQWNAEHTRIYTTVVVSVEDSMKGLAEQKNITITVPGGEVDGIREWVSDTPVFNSGDRTAVFLRHYPDKDIFNVVGGFQGRFLIDGDKIGKLYLKDFKELINKALRGETLPQEAEEELDAVDGPNITEITPDSASAGTNNRVIIRGNNFENTQGQVHFFYKSGQPTIQGSIIDWSNNEIVVEVPVANINGYPASASSGPVYVRTASGSDSNSYPFTVTFSYYGAKWSGDNPVVSYKVNPNTSDCYREEIAVQNAANTWNAVPNKNFAFSYAGRTTVTEPKYNNSNDVMWGNLGQGVLAQASMWSYINSTTLLECDIEFNDSYSWSTSATPQSRKYDVQSILLHEMGHWLSLRDLYGNVNGYPQDSAKVMYGSGSPGTSKRTLHDADKAGIQWIYPGSSAFNVSGTITNSNGGALPGATMTFSRITGSGSIPASVTTNYSGNWSQAGFESGATYRVTPSKTGYTFSPEYFDFNGASSSLDFTGVTSSLPARGYLDTPKNGQTLSGTARISGWFLDGSGVSTVVVLVDGKVHGQAAYGDSRLDVYNVFPQYNNHNSGFHYDLNTQALANGSHTITIRETGTNDSQKTLNPVTVNVLN